MANNYSHATLDPLLPASLFTEEELDALAFACGLRSERDGDLLYFFAEESFWEEGEDRHEQLVNCVKLFQGKLRLLDAGEYPRITIEGAHTCSKMRPGEFGGFAYYITRDEVRYHATWQWLDEMAAGKARPPSHEHRLIAALKAILPYAESDAESLAETHKRDGGLELQPHVEAAQRAIVEARAILALAEGRSA